MATLTDLGIHHEALLSLQRKPGDPPWITGQSFSPAIGECYEITYGAIPYRGKQAHVFAKVRIDGATPDQWYDLDEDKLLDPVLAPHVVLAYRRI